MENRRVFAKNLDHKWQKNNNDSKKQNNDKQKTVTILYKISKIVTIISLIILFIIAFRTFKTASNTDDDNKATILLYVGIFYTENFILRCILVANVSKALNYKNKSNYITSLVFSILSDEIFALIASILAIKAYNEKQAIIEEEKRKDPNRYAMENAIQEVPEGKEVLLSIKHVDITFGNRNRPFKAVSDATFDIYKGETFSLVGESGSGKTTIGRAVIRINPCSAGEILFEGQRISGKISRAQHKYVVRNIQMVFQDPAASLNERATIEYIISEGLYNFHLYEDESDRVNKIETVIKEVGLLPEHLTRYPHEFSGGQRQRVGLARAIVMEPKLIIADEPISALDVSIRAQILNLLKKFQKEKGLTYLFIAHDLSIVRFISDRIGVIYKGKIVEIAEAEELFRCPLHPYTKSLISSIPIPDPELEKKKVLYVYDPSMHDYSVDKPYLRDIGNHHYVYCNDKEASEYIAIHESAK